MRVLLLSLLGCLACLNAEVKGSGPIGVLNLEEVIRNAKIYTARLEPLRQEQVDAQSTMKAYDEQEKQLKGALEVINKGNEMYAKKQEELEVLKVRKKMFYDRTVSGLEKRNAAAMRDGYAAMKIQLKAFAEEKGLKLIQLAPMGDLSTNPDHLQLQLTFQSVLYYDEALDITKAFISFANGRFVADEGVKAPAPEEQPTPDGGDAAPAPTQP